MFIQETLVKHQKHNTGRTHITQWDTQSKNGIKTDKRTNAIDKLPIQTQWRK